MLPTDRNLVLHFKLFHPRHLQYISPLGGSYILNVTPPKNQIKLVIGKFLSAWMECVKNFPLSLILFLITKMMNPLDQMESPGNKYSVMFSAVDNLMPSGLHPHRDNPLCSYHSCGEFNGSGVSPQDVCSQDTKTTDIVWLNIWYWAPLHRLWKTQVGLGSPSCRYNTIIFEVWVLFRSCTCSAWLRSDLRCRWRRAEVQPPPCHLFLPWNNSNGLP